MRSPIKVHGQPCSSSRELGVLRPPSSTRSLQEDLEGLIRSVMRRCCRRCSEWIG